MKVKVLFMAVFTLFNVAFSFLLDTNNIYLQSFHFIGGTAIFIMFIDMFKTNAIEWRFLKIVLISYWCSTIVLYVVNMIRFDSFNEWITHFNDYLILIPLYTLTIVGTCIYAIKTIK